MILSQKITRFIHHIALFAIVFASVAPSISHALAAQQGINSFVQQICTSDGQTITIQVMTSKGQQLETSLIVDEANRSAPADIVLHLNHCPFCGNPSIHAALEPPYALIVDVLAAQAEQLETPTVIASSSFSVLPPPAQAPPTL